MVVFPLQFYALQDRKHGYIFKPQNLFHDEIGELEIAVRPIFLPSLMRI